MSYDAANRKYNSQSLGFSATFISSDARQESEMRCNCAFNEKYYYMPLIYDLVIKANKVNCIFLQSFFYHFMIFFFYYF